MKNTEIEQSNFIKFLEDKGYSKHKGHYKNEDYGYWKRFKEYINGSEEETLEYQIAILVYDYSKYPDFKDDKIYGIQFEFIGHIEEYISRLDFSVSDGDITLEMFEHMCNYFHSTMIEKYIKKKYTKRNDY